MKNNGCNTRKRKTFCLHLRKTFESFHSFAKQSGVYKQHKLKYSRILFSILFEPSTLFLSVIKMHTSLLITSMFFLLVLLCEIKKKYLLFSKLRMSLQSSKILYFVATIIHQKGIKGLREFMMLQKRPYTAVIVMLDHQKLYIY